MDLVKNWEQVVANIRRLEKARDAKEPGLHRAYLSLVKKGTCFVAYRGDQGIAFAPSRFIGYVGNDIPTHMGSRSERDGRDTNKALEGLLDRTPEIYPAAEAAYRKFCESIGIEPGKTGTFGAPRKFWITDEVVDIVEAAAVATIRSDPGLTQTEKDQLVKARLGQGQFRKGLISLWGKCCLTGCAALGVLRASHIKPWSASNNRERLDRYNGLLLTPNADALFDRGYITFSDGGDLLMSSKLPRAVAQALLAGCGKRIQVHEANKPYLEYHRKNRFRGSAAQL